MELFTSGFAPRNNTFGSCLRYREKMPAAGAKQIAGNKNMYRLFTVKVGPC